MVTSHFPQSGVVTLGPMFIFKEININHQSDPPSYEFSNDLSKTMGLHFIMNIKNICWLK